MKKSFWKRIFENSDIIGGIFGVIAVIAIILEMNISGFDNAAIAGGVKDIAGTLVTVLVLFAFIPKRGWNFESKLTAALNEWISDNSNMLIHNEKMDGNISDNKFGIGMKTDMNSYFSNNPNSQNYGWFVRLPKPDKKVYQEKITLEFHLNKGTFFEGVNISADELKNKYTLLNDKFCSLINLRHQGFAEATGRGQDISVILQKPIKTDKDIEELVNVLNSMYQAYLVAANIKI